MQGKWLKANSVSCLVLWFHLLMLSAGGWVICVGEEGHLLVESACETTCHNDPASEDDYTDEAAPDSHEACGGCTDHLWSEMVGVNCVGSRALLNLALHPQYVFSITPIHPVVPAEVEAGRCPTNAPPPILPPPAKGLATTVIIC